MQRMTPTISVWVPCGYTDDILRNLENTISHSMDAAKARHDAYVSSLQGFLDVVTANRAELNPTAEEPETKTTDAQASQADGPKVEISRICWADRTHCLTDERSVRRDRQAVRSRQQEAVLLYAVAFYGEWCVADHGNLSGRCRTVRRRRYRPRPAHTGWT